MDMGCLLRSKGYRADRLGGNEALDYQVVHELPDSRMIMQDIRHMH